ncbi:energy-coupling factor ABC transporter ATP-binding protein [Halosimplex aquaticum]|uniref:Energy-coupling factor ABC transporter ATP-binding protein n=1 Tax=Halosimplex aquaticum TaxID=3026162 RepID=A0ABD5Y0F9_9EURY|nr:ABC transporter ATP-binding protein [Halosimplex aquaticum]
MIETESLVHRYGEAAAVDGVSLTIDDGEAVAVVGANGSGKTTLVRHFNALLEPDEGSVAVDGRDVTEHTVYARTSVGMVFQHPRDQFVSATVGADVAFGPENLGLDREAIDRRVADALAAVDMAGRGDERIDRLSGGEQARVAIAGVLAMDPDHLVMDEPLVGLDSAARESVLAQLDSLATDGTGLVVVTHDLRDLAERVDRIVGLADGRVVLDDDPASALDRLDSVGVRDPRC